MTTDQVILRLRSNESELRAAGIVSLAVFESVARGDNRAGSDVDLLTDFDVKRHHTLLTVGKLELQLGELLGVKVDLSSPEWLKGSVKEQALREAVFAF